MPPKKAVSKKEVVPEVVLSDDESVIVESPKKVAPKKVQAMVKLNSSSGDSDRLQLAQAINNLVFKGDAFVSALESISSMTQERLTELEIQIEAEKMKYQDMVSNNTKKYDELTCDLENKYKMKQQQLDNDYNNKFTQLGNDHKNKQIEIKQHLNEFKVEGCNQIAKDFNMMLIKTDEYNRVVTDAEDAKDKLETMRNELEEKHFDEMKKEREQHTKALIQEKSMSDLSHKAQTAELTAQVTQQRKEIEMLLKTIENMKFEIAEQRNLTKEVAVASSKAQITQKIGSQ